MKICISLPLAALALACMAQPALADVSITGFGQVVAGKTLDKNETYPSRLYDNEIDFAEESLIGVQFSAPLNDRVSATAQIVAKGQDDFEADLAWAYASITLSDTLEMKIGRQRTPFFGYSDFKDVGYAYTWMRPPTPVYAVNFDNMDAVSLTHNTQLGRWSSRLQGFYGSYSDSVLVGGIPTQNKFWDFVGIAWDGNYDDWLTLRAAMLRTDLDVSQAPLEALLGAMRQFGLGAAAELIAVEDDVGEFYGYGFTVDRNNWLVGGEYSRIGVDKSLFALSNNWYLSVGHRFGAFTPYVVYGERSAAPYLEPLALIPNGHPLKPVVEGGLRAQAHDDSYVSAGVRWDFAPNIAFKADFSRHRSDVPGRNGSELLSLGVAFTF